MPQAGGTRVRATRQVAAVIAVMSGMRAFCGARDIYDVLRRCGHHVGLATVYRHLHVLAERGEAGAIYTASGEPVPPPGQQRDLPPHLPGLRLHRRG